MHLSRQLFVILIFALVMTAPFNNCATVSTPDTRVDQASGRTNLNVQIENPGKASFDPQTGAMTLNGRCNAEAFRQNVVWWSIEMNGKKVWDSYLAGGEEKLGHCADKKFSILVTSPCKSGAGDCDLLGDAKSALTVRAHIAGVFGDNADKLETSSDPLTLVR